MNQTNSLVIFTKASQMNQTNSLVIFTKASQMLAEANTIQKAKELKNLALTAADWAKRKGMGEEAIQYCRSYALEAERKLGTMLKATERAPGGRPIGDDKRLTSPGTGLVKEALTLADLGLTKNESTEAQLLAELPAEEFEQIKSGRKTKTKAKKEQRARKEKEALRDAATRIAADKAQALHTVCDIRHCSCAELFQSGIRPDVVITDPPYAQQFLPVFSELASACIKVPLVAVMVGQSYLPTVLARLSEHLTYRWMLAYLTPGGQSPQIWPRKVNTFWKPVLLFGTAAHWIGDVLKSKENDNDKRFHSWGQSESGMAALIEMLTQPGQLICDPFVGGGTTAVAALAVQRRFIGCDVDERAVHETLDRVKGLLYV